LTSRCSVTQYFEGRLGHSSLYWLWLFKERVGRNPTQLWLRHMTVKWRRKLEKSCTKNPFSQRQ
jgi:hypothetical protein